MNRSRALGIYLAMTIPFGSIVHLSAEAVSLARSPIALAIAPLHRYLAVLGLLALAAVWFLIAQVPAADRRRQLSLFAHGLPFSGKGPQFAAFGAATQIAFFLATEFAERGPLGSGDLWLGICAAVVVAVVGSLVLIAVHRRLTSIVAILCGSTAPRVPAASAARRTTSFAPSVPYFAYLPSRGSRPPPLAPVR